MKELFLFYLAILTVDSVIAFERELKMVKNPGWPETDSLNDLVYTSATGAYDTLHYLWTTVGSPTVLIVKTDLHAQININYEKLFSPDPEGAISFYNGSILNSFGVVFNRFFEFNDEANKGNITSANQTYSVTAWTVNSSFTDITKNTSYAVDVLFNSSIMLQMSTCKGSARHSLLPHLLYTANSTQVELIMNHNATYNKSRMAVELFFFSENPKNSTITFNSNSSIDDEYTPGIFNISELKMPSGLSDPAYVGYLQWKPLSYQSQKRLVKDITLLMIYPIVNGELYEFESPIIKAFYSGNISELLIKKTNFSFGIEGNDFYNNFLSWTLIIGLGEPVIDTISLGIISIIAVVLGLPIVIFIGGIILLKIKKKQTQPKIRSMYEAIN